jgi:putative ABC transport system permease protein
VTTLVLAFFGVAATVISVCGVYGMTMHATSQRRHEVGVRIALGASPVKVLVVLVREMVVTAVAGTLVGVALSWSLAAYLQTILFGVQPRDPAIFALIPLGCTVVSTACAALASLRLVRLGPVDALRST